jgi:hypothetical protein
MTRQSRRDLTLLVQPYMFVLKGGSAIKKDPLNYSLTILHVSCSEVLKSPTEPLPKSPIQEIKANAMQRLKEGVLKKLAKS